MESKHVRHLSENAEKNDLEKYITTIGHNKTNISALCSVLLAYKLTSGRKIPLKKSFSSLSRVEESMMI